MEILLNILALLMGFAIVVISIPPVIKIAREKKLYEPLDERKHHARDIPPFGGVAIFIGFVISTIVATESYVFESLKYIIASIILIFFIGLKDDFLVITVKNKLIVQIFAAVLLITLGNVHFTNLHGIFGLYEIHYFSTVFVSLFVMIGIINAFNLIDGIDGLASGLAMLAGTFFGVWFYLAGQIPFSIMSFALVGSLAGFFLFNVFGKQNKLFMGDAGSLVIGLIVSTLVIKFNEFNIIKTAPYAINAAPAVSFAVLTVPVIDTLRVITIRLMQKKSPFSPDRNHIHHKLLIIVPNHFKVTLILISVSSFLIGFALFLNKISMNINIQIFLIFSTGNLLSFIPAILTKRDTIHKKKTTKPARIRRHPVRIIDVAVEKEPKEIDNGTFSCSIEGEGISGSSSAWYK